MVGHGGGRMSSGSRRRISVKLILALQKLDGARQRTGLDQHENHSGYHLLRHHNPHWDLQTLAGRRSDGATVAT